MSTAVQPEIFPFRLEDLKYWIIRRTDGTVTKFNITGKPDVNRPIGSTHPFVSHLGTSNSPATKPDTSGSGWYKFCNHSPNPNTTPPLFEEGGVRLWVADAVGLRGGFRAFDHVLDCGDVLPDNIAQDFKGCTFNGDPYMVEKFKPYSKYNNPTILRVDWYDRKAPPLVFDFWPAYTDEVKGDVVVACQGGHGRSGSSAVMMMMCLIPDYTPYDAICHLRALHCPRAIESKEQHEYIGAFGAFLGRENNVALVSDVKNFKNAFLALKVKGAEKYQAQLRKTYDGNEEKKD